MQTTQDIEQFTAIVSKDTFPFESVLLYASQNPFYGYEFGQQLANNIHATFYSFSDIEKNIQKEIRELQDRYKKYLAPIARFDIDVRTFWESILLSTAASQEELLVHLLKKIATRKGRPPHKVIIFFDSLSLTKIKNFKSLINPSDLVKDSRFNNFIFITATSDSEMQNYGTKIQAELDRFDRKIQIIKKQE